MKKKDVNKLYMYETVKQACAKYADAWANVPAIVESINSFNARVLELWALDEEHKHPIKNFAQNKAKMRRDLVENYLVLREIMKMHALRTDNYELMLVATPNKSRLLYGKEALCVAHCRSFATAFQVILPELDSTTLDQASVDRFISLINHFEAAISSPRNAIIARRMLTVSISAKVREIDRILSVDLDALVGLLKNTQAEFVEEYHLARIIIPYATKHHPDTPLVPVITKPSERDDGNDAPNLR